MFIMSRKQFPNVPTRNLHQEWVYLEVFFTQDDHPEDIEEFLKHVCECQSFSFLDWKQKKDSILPHIVLRMSFTKIIKKMKIGRRKSLIILHV